VTDYLDKVARRDIPLVLPTSAVREEKPSDIDEDLEDEESELIRKPPYPAADDDDLDDTPPPTPKRGRKKAAATKENRKYL
jgi:hypothetical protein